MVYILGGYQAGRDQDFDPDEEAGTAMGLTRSDIDVGLGYQACIIFLEIIVDVATKYGYNATTVEQQTVVHEVGHQVLESGTHTANTIMNAGLPVAPAHEKFSDADIAAIREQVSSPGK